MANEAIIADGDQFTNKGVGLDPAALTDGDPFLDFDKRTDEAAIAELAIVNIARFNDGYVLAELDVSNRDVEEPGFH